MPHLTLEYTNNLRLFDAAKALRELNDALIESKLFDSDRPLRMASRTWMSGLNAACAAVIPRCIGGRRVEKAACSLSA